MKTYKIIRFFRMRPSKVMQRGLTLEEAQEHCNNPATEKEGVSFDGYTQE